MIVNSRLKYNSNRTIDQWNVPVFSLNFQIVCCLWDIACSRSFVRWRTSVFGRNRKDCRQQRSLALSSNFDKFVHVRFLTSRNVWLTSGITNELELLLFFLFSLLATCYPSQDQDVNWKLVIRDLEIRRWTLIRFLSDKQIFSEKNLIWLYCTIFNIILWVQNLYFI